MAVSAACCGSESVLPLYLFPATELVCFIRVGLTAHAWDFNPAVAVRSNKPVRALIYEKSSHATESMNMICDQQLHKYDDFLRKYSEHLS